jgi:DNA-binding LacI/PurR family transcriptional regulator
VRDRVRNMLIKSGARAGDPVPTYRDLSQRLQVSLVTVQRAMDELCNEGLVRGWPGKGTFLARDLSPAGRKLTQIGLVYYGSRRLFFSSDYLMEVFQGIMLSAEDLGADVRIFSLKSEGRIGAREIEASGVDGLLLLGVANEDYIAELARELLPMVVVDYAAQEPCDYLVVDNAQAVASVMQHLARLGHTRIAYLDGCSTDPLRQGEPPVETSDTRERREAYTSEMARLGFQEHTRIFSVVDGRPEVDAARAARTIARNRNGTTAVVAYDADVARHFVEALRRCRVRVPEACSVAAVAGAGGANVGEQTLTFNRVRFVEMGQRAVELLAQRCRGGKESRAHTTRIASDFVKGNTCAALPEKTSATRALSKKEEIP